MKMKEVKLREKSREISEIDEDRSTFFPEEVEYDNVSI